jgi:hypothetical protein
MVSTKITEKRSQTKNLNKLKPNSCDLEAVEGPRLPGQLVRATFGQENLPAGDAA